MAMRALSLRRVATSSFGRSFRRTLGTSSRPAAAWSKRAFLAVPVVAGAAIAGSYTFAEEKKAPAVKLQDKYKYVIVGMGVAGYAALKEIIKEDPKASVLVISESEYYPHYVPALSKELWQGNHMATVVETLSYKDNEGATRSIFFEDAQKVFASPNVTFAQGVRASTLDPDERTITLEDGRVVKYEECLLATGAKPKELKCGGGDDAVMTFRGIDDFRKLVELQRAGKDVVVVGGGYLGTELVDAMNSRSKEAGTNAAPREGKKQRQVTMVVPEPGVLYRFFPRYLSDFAANKMAQHGVDMRTNTLITNITRAPGKDHLLVELTVRTLGNLRTGLGSSTKGWADIRKYTIKADAVVVAVGVVPSVELAKNAGLEVDAVNGGIVADAKFSVHPGVYAVGDAVSYYDPVLGRRRMEHWEHAEASGTHAGKNMVKSARGEPLEKWDHISSFWCELSDLGIKAEGVGNINSSLRTVGFLDVSKKFFSPPDDHVPPFETSEYTKGVVYYLDDDDKVVGVLLWNLKGKLEQARRIVMDQKKVDDVLDLRKMITGSNGQPFRQIHTS